MATALNIPNREQIDTLNTTLSSIASNLNNSTNVGSLSTLNTSDKTSVVAAINEIKKNVDDLSGGTVLASSMMAESAKNYTSDGAIATALNGKLSTSGTAVYAAGYTSNGGIATAINGKVSITGADTITGVKTFSTTIKANLNDALVRTTDTNSVNISGGNTSSVGAMLTLNGGNQATVPGVFEIKARKSTGTVSLIGKPDGTLTWNGVNLLTETSGTSTISTLAVSANNYTATGAIATALNGKLASSGTAVVATKAITADNYTATGAIATALNGKLATSHNTDTSAHADIRAFATSIKVTADAALPKSGGTLTGKVTGTVTYADSAGSATNATTASKVGSSNIGDANTPVYVNAGTLTSTGKSFANYLPLAGGTMTNSIVVQDALNVIHGLSTSSFIGISGGLAHSNGACILLGGMAHGTYAGQFLIRAHANSSSDTFVELAGKPDGSLTWGGTFYASGNISTGGVVYNAVWNDYAELFERGEDTEAGDIIALDESSDKEQYVKATYNSLFVVGVHSDTYGHLLGGDKDKTVEENLENFIPVGLAGRLNVKFIGKSKLGYPVVPSDIPGVGRLFNEETDSEKKIIGIIVYDNNAESEELRKVRIMIKK